MRKTRMGNFVIGEFGFAVNRQLSRGASVFSRNRLHRRIVRSRLIRQRIETSRRNVRAFSKSYVICPTCFQRDNLLRNVDWGRWKVMNIKYSRLINDSPAVIISWKKWSNHVLACRIQVYLIHSPHAAINKNMFATSAMRIIALRCFVGKTHTHTHTRVYSRIRTEGIFSSSRDIILSAFCYTRVIFIVVFHFSTMVVFITRSGRKFMVFLWK